jgi:hypothetical protein
VLEATLKLDEVNLERWRVGLAQFDCARSLLDRLGMSDGPGDYDFYLELSPRAGRLLLDALRATYKAEVHRLANESDRVALPLHEIPALRNFILETERRLGKTTTHLEPLLDSSEKRSPRTVKLR